MLRSTADAARRHDGQAQLCAEKQTHRCGQPGVQQEQLCTANRDNSGGVALQRATYA
jgi:hypothetical protein